MGKITGNEPKEQLPEKVLLLYKAVGEWIEEGADIESLSVSDLTQKAGIGKGTAYDYFETKEEIIMYAILYNFDKAMEGFQEHLLMRSTFRERILYALESAELKMKERNCILKYVNLMFSSTQVGNLLRSRMENTSPKDCPPFLLGGRIIREGIEREELRADLPISYMLYILLAKIVAYMAYLGKQQEGEVTDEEFRQYILEGIMDEFEKR